MEQDLFYQEAVGLKTTIHNMPRKPKVTHEVSNEKLCQIVALLKFILTLDDEEIQTTAIESIIELLEEEINK